MTFRKLILILSFTVTTVIIMLLSTSYAWYQFDNAVTTFSNVQTYNEDINLDVVFTNDDNINTTVGIPITPDQVENYSSKTKFTLTPAASLDKDIAFQISLINLDIPSELTAVTDLKYSLIQTIGSGNATTVSSGNFKDISRDTLELMPITKITNYGTTHYYEFRLWLEETGGDQNNLMGKRITGKIKVSAAYK